MVLDLILYHNLDAEWLIERPINVLIELFERHIQSFNPMPMMPFIPTQTITKSDLYETKTWKEGKTTYNRVNLLEAGSSNTKGISIKEGLISSRNTKLARRE